jgi:hypothetical protein
MPEPVRPADLPSKAEARAKAVTILEAMGFDPEHGGLRVEDGFSVWSVVFEPYIDGVRAADLGASISIGSKGRIEWASGWVSQFEKVGDYPLATLATAVERLNSGFTPGPKPMADDLRSMPPEGESGPATTNAVAGSEGGAAQVPAAHPASPTTEPAECGGPAVECTKTTPAPCHDTPELTADCAIHEPVCLRDGAQPPPAAADASGAEPTTSVTEPAPCPPLPTPEPQIVTLTSVKMGLTLAPVFDGQSPAYIVPAYLFDGADVSDVSVVAVADDLLAKPEPEPATKDGGEEPAPADGGTPVTLIAPVPKD